MPDKDWNSQGQHDQEESREEGWQGILQSGGGSSHYDPPNDADDKKEYDAGWNNAKKTR